MVVLAFLGVRANVRAFPCVLEIELLPWFVRAYV
jgi:hypothetical protein